MNIKPNTNRITGLESMPVYAWKLDNTLPTSDSEILIKLEKLHIESENFNQLYFETMGDEKKIKENLMSIVSQRGKVHNPFTGTGGLLCGVVESIGKNCKEKGDIKVGDEVVVLVSLTMLPLYLKTIKSIDFAYGIMSVEGYAICYDGCPMVKKPRDINWDVMLCAFDESASIFEVTKLAQDKNDLLVIGSSSISTILYGLALKDIKKPDGKLVALIYGDKITDSFQKFAKKRDEVCKLVFDEVYKMETSDLQSIVPLITKKGERLFDLVVNCSEQNGAEAVSVLSTKEKGDIFFSNLTNNYTYAIFIQESINREMNIRCSSGFVKEYQDFMIDFLQKHKDMLKTIMNSLAITKEIRDEEVRDSESLTTSEIEKLMKSRSLVMKKISKEIGKAAMYDCPIIIEGESGSGKEVVANTIHMLSERNTMPLVKVNCAAIPKELMESEFFGYEPGAFTGALREGKDGFFKMADGGILLLDEIGEMPYDLQAKLLRVIQDGEFFKVGGHEVVRSNVRIIASTNKNLKEEVKKGRFREDLYYRLSVMNVKVPALRDRKEDIDALVDVFMEKYQKQYSITRAITPEARQMLKEYDWPGNVRELENTIQRLMVSSDEKITCSDILGQYEEEKPGDNPFINQEDLSFNEKVEQFERRILMDALKECGSTYKASEKLKMTQSQFMRKKKKYELE